MLLKAFLDDFRREGDAFLSTYTGPFLVEEGRLEVEEEGPLGARRAYYLGVGGEVLIGRKEPADVRIIDRNVSGKHAKLVPPEMPGLFWTIVDLGSTNGTFINGEQASAGEPQMLTDEMVVAFGPVLNFVFQEPATFLGLLKKIDARTPRTPEADTDEIDLNATVADLNALDAFAGTVQPPKADAPTVKTLFVECQPFGRAPLIQGGRVIVGRSPDQADLALLGQKQISRTHMEVRWDGKRITVRDLDSANGVVVDGVKLPPDTPIPISVDSIIKLDRYEVTVSTGASEDGDSTVSLTPKQVKQKKKVIRGTFDKVPLGQILAGVEDKAKSGHMTVQSPELSGQIVFHAGRPWSAATDTGLSGVEALRAMLRISTGTFAIDPTPVARGDRQISESFSELVLEDFLESG